MKYLFHNIYGDADDLIASKPEGVITVPYGWDEKTEKNRIEILNSLNLRGVSGLPVYVFPHPSHKYLVPERRYRDLVVDENGDTLLDENNEPIYSDVETVLPAEIGEIESGYLEVAIYQFEKPWKWEDILQKERELLSVIEAHDQEVIDFLNNN